MKANLLKKIVKLMTTKKKQENYHRSEKIYSNIFIKKAGRNPCFKTKKKLSLT